MEALCSVDFLASKKNSSGLTSGAVVSTDASQQEGSAFELAAWGLLVCTLRDLSSSHSPKTRRLGELAIPLLAKFPIGVNASMNGRFFLR